MRRVAAALIRGVRFWCSPRGECRGQALAEFAITFPMILFVLFAAMQVILLYVSALVVDFAAFRACRAALVAWDVNDDGTVNTADQEENAYAAAQLVVSPLAFHRASSGGAPLTVPGWGELAGSASADTKLSVSVQDEPEEGQLRVVVQFPQELVFPFVDAAFGVMAGAWSKTPPTETDSVWGTKQYASVDDWSKNETPYYGNPELPRVIRMNGRWHYVIARAAVMPKLSDVEPSR